MNAKRFVTLLLLPSLLFVCVMFAMGGNIMEPFSTHMKRAELVFIGTLVDRQYVYNEVTNGFVTDLTFDVDHLIEGSPNVDKDTVVFCIPGGEGINPETGDHVHHWSSMGQGFAKLEVGDNVLMLLKYNTHIAKWMPRHEGLYPVSEGHGCWFVKSKKVNEKTEYTVFIWASAKDRLDKPYLGMPLPLFVRLMNAARKHPERINAVADVTNDATMEGLRGAVIPNTPAADRIHEPAIDHVMRVLDELDAIDAEAERK